MGSLQVGLVDYINAYPFSAAFTKNKVAPEANIIYDTPAHLNEKLKTGELDIALTSAITYLNDKKQFDFLPGYGLGANGPVMSVNLYVKGEVADLDGVTVGLTSQSAMSIALLETLCKKYWKVKPIFETLDPSKNIESYQAFLLIGDEALQKREIPGYKTIDLGEAWCTSTQLGFTFALFVVQKEALSRKQMEIEIFTQALEESLKWGEDNRDEIIAMGAEKSGLSKEVVSSYYNTLIYRLTKEEMRGLSVFDYLRVSDFHVQTKRP